MKQLFVPFKPRYEMLWRMHINVSLAAKERRFWRFSFQLLEGKEIFASCNASRTSWINNTFIIAEYGIG